MSALHFKMRKIFPTRVFEQMDFQGSNIKRFVPSSKQEVWLLLPLAPKKHYNSKKSYLLIEKYDLKRKSKNVNMAS